MDIRQAIRQWMDDHRKPLTDFLVRTVREKSVQGDERGVQLIVAEKLAELGLEVDVWEPGGEELLHHPYFRSTRTSFSESPNVVGIWRGTGGGRSLIVNGHVDVVPAGDPTQWRGDPFSGEVRDGKLYGRGATDMKGGNAAILFAIACLKSLGLRLKGDVIFQSVVEEESGGAGTLAAILRGYRADAALIPEPTGMKIFPKQQGSMWFRIRVKGRSAHGGTRYEGVSAIEKSSLILQAIADLERKRNERIRDPLYQQIPIPIPINVGTVKGGEWPSSVPDMVELEGRFGVAPEEDMEEAKRELESCLASIDDEWLRQHPPELEWFGAHWLPGKIESEHAFLKCLVESYQEILKEQPVVEASPWGTDGGLLTNVALTPTVVFGPGVTSVAHYPNEYVELDRVVDCAVIVALSIVKWCMIDESEKRG